MSDTHDPDEVNEWAGPEIDEAPEDEPDLLEEPVGESPLPAWLPAPTIVSERPPVPVHGPPASNRQKLDGVWYGAGILGTPLTWVLAAVLGSAAAGGSGRRVYLLPQRLQQVK